MTQPFTPEEVLYQFFPNEEDKSLADYHYGVASEYVVAQSGIYGWYPSTGTWRGVALSAYPIVVHLLRERDLYRALLLEVLRDCPVCQGTPLCNRHAQWGVALEKGAKIREGE